VVLAARRIEKLKDLRAQIEARAATPTSSGWT
jgi:NADP-dependent 3-hydroxy acid dehydrogenase YdfG